MAARGFERIRAHVASWRAERARVGTRQATVHRIRSLLDLGPVTSGRVELMTGQIDRLQGRVGDDEVGADRRFDALDRRFDDTTRAVDETKGAVEREAATAAAHRAESELFQQVWTTTAWLESVPVEEDVLVSVALPTRGVRRRRLRAAVDSVLRQAYGNWELVVAVDGTEDTVAAVTAQLPRDERVRVVRSPRTGVSAARNTAFDEGRGEIVAYVDDDNLMGPLWLKAVVWTAGRHPDAAVFVGAQLLESGLERGLSEDRPALWIHPFDRARLRRGNYIDQGAVAHRRNLPEAHYDESLSANVDWDFLLRVTERREPAMIPVVAGHYRTDANDRITNDPDAARSWEVVRARARAMTPLRVLALNEMYPLISETYTGEDLDALAREGAEIACCVLGKRSAPAPSPYPLYHDPVVAVAEHEPDVVLVHWAYVGLKRRALLHELGVPYAVRGHSFAAEPDQVRQLVEDPRCVGVWCFPHHGFDHPRIHPLPTVFTSHESLPHPASERDLVLSSSAGLPKKDFSLLVAAFGALEGVERRIVVGTTAEYESVVTDLVLATQELDDPPLVQANLTRPQVFELLGRTSVLVYTLAPDAGFGCPMSVVEAMTAGACVVLPERPEVRRVFGPDVRTYATVDDIVHHVRTVMAGGPAVAEERERLRSWALERFCDPEIGKRFYDELARAVRAEELGR
jgi:glycosyltransferase involved in cell wall biosynthesis